ncbi:Transaldolase [Frankliniella fusca]|uniref:Transaldolase n=1 Tax=Frankliniella fusca TaxID=407009 RepID=A0AAE1HQR3_9NEOP|nr:Transaldolase [Frankliniella fusca]
MVADMVADMVAHMVAKPGPAHWESMILLLKRQVLMTVPPLYLKRSRSFEVILRNRLDPKLASFQETSSFHDSIANNGLKPVTKYCCA